MKMYYDWGIEKREFHVGDLLLLLNSRFKLFLGKQKSMWYGPFRVTQVVISRVVDLENKDGNIF